MPFNYEKVIWERTRERKTKTTMYAFSVISKWDLNCVCVCARFFLHNSMNFNTFSTHSFAHKTSNLNERGSMINIYNKNPIFKILSDVSAMAMAMAETFPVWIWIDYGVPLAIYMHSIIGLPTNILHERPNCLHNISITTLISSPFVSQIRKFQFHFGIQPKPPPSQPAVVHNVPLEQVWMWAQLTNTQVSEQQFSMQKQMSFGFTK